MVTYLIFGKPVEFVYDDSRFSYFLKKEMELYPKSDDDPLVRINIVNDLNTSYEYRNPRIFKQGIRQFECNISGYDIRWCFNQNLLNILIKTPDDSKFISTVKRLHSIQYTDKNQQSGMVVHELILVPLAYFFDDIAPVHCSSFVFDDRGVIIGGTGGVGKTSSVLNLRDKILFNSDDIAMIDDSGCCYPNYAYPKIYAYNATNDKKLKNAIIQDNSLLGRIQWRIRSLLGEDKVRRRVDPSKIYKISNGKIPVKIYIILFSSNRVNIKINEIDSALASELTLQVMKTEYSTVNNYFIWHKYNTSIMRKESEIDIDNSFKSWMSIYENAFSKIRCFAIDVPMDMKPHDLNSELIGLLESCVADQPK